ncbi:MAG: YqzL family protein [Clostridia bacterium]|nr:YqzL family protein [Clostridia bacterium]
MDKQEAWKCFENTGSVEAYLLYNMLEKKEKEPRNDAQGQGYFASDGADRS